MGSVGEGNTRAYNAKPHPRTSQAIPPGRVGPIAPGQGPDSDKQHAETLCMLHRGTWWPHKVWTAKL